MKRTENKEFSTNRDDTHLLDQRNKKKDLGKRKKIVEKDKKEDQRKKPPKRSVKKKSKTSTTSIEGNKTTENSKECADSETDEFPTPTATPQKISVEKSKGRRKETSKLSARKKGKEKKVSKEEDDKTKELEREKKEKEKEEKQGKKFNMQLAQLFFKKISESQRSTKTTNIDKNLEVMPYLIPKRNSVEGTRKRSSSRHRPLDRSIFKENGEPVWVVPDRAEDVMTADGVMTKYPELMEALEEEGLKMEDGKQWAGMMEEFMGGQLDSGILDAGFTVDQLNPFDTFESLKKRSDKYFRIDSVVYYTMANMLNLSKEAIEKFSQQGSIMGSSLPSIQAETEMKRLESTANTAVVTSILFNMDTTFCVTYDLNGYFKLLSSSKWNSMILHITDIDEDELLELVKKDHRVFINYHLFRFLTHFWIERNFNLNDLKTELQLQSFFDSNPRDSYRNGIEQLCTYPLAIHCRR